MRISILLLILPAIILHGCRDFAGVSGSRSDPPVSQAPPAASEAMTTQPIPKEVMAYVNGRAIYMDQLHEILIESYGLERARQLIASELVLRAAFDQNLTADAQEVAAEHQQTLDTMFPSPTEPDQRERLLDELLMRRDISRLNWDITMHRNVLLSKLALGRAGITDDELRKQFEEKYGPKVVVRHIQSASLDEAQKVMEKLHGGENFAELAKRVSKNRSGANGGLLPPIGSQAKDLPTVLRRAARAMKQSGEISEPIQVGTTFHILYLERFIESQDVQFEEVRDSLNSELRLRKLRAMKQQILAELIDNADIKYVNPTLKSLASQARNGDIP